MLGGRIVLKRGAKDEAEKPFWISYADLMTALMMLFLVTMSVALLAVTKTVSESEREEAEYKRDINLLLDKVASAIERYPGVSLDRERRVIDFEERARFDFRKHQLAQEEAKLLRKFVPEVVLAIARDELGRRWLRRIVVEGFTDNTGSYC
jgi:flagellar motor protein MotB